GALATDYVRADAAETLRALARAAAPLETLPAPADPAWRGDWEAASSSSSRAAAEHEGDDDDEGRVMAEVVRTLPRGSSLFVSSSMPVRDLDAYGHPRDGGLHVWANRGASGIDGVVSSAFGVAAASAGPTVCVLGDVAFFHDQNGLLWNREEDAPVVFVLVDNDGGGIFHMLPVRDHEPYFTRCFVTPHGLDFQHAARMHGVPFQDVGIPGLAEALGRALDAGGTRVLRVRTDGVRAQARRRDVADAVARSVRETLG
ncbi:MAG TPA: thiamine pyrophosphate-binding protein, partial [Longimicrobiales bacterium]|nr:thiamine pyrophosphate-binding protein [Longimicrobiales bacterium]